MSTNDGLLSSMVANLLLNGQFYTAFVITLAVVATLAGLAAVGFLLYRAWILTKPACQRLGRTAPIQFARNLWTLARAGGARLNAAYHLFVIAPIRTAYRAVATVAKTPIDGSMVWFFTLAAAVVAMPLVAFWLTGLPVPAMLGVVTAGAFLGGFVGLYVAWQYRTSGSGKIVGSYLLSILGGAYGTVLLITLFLMKD